jgi:hypothetical protein
MRSPGREKLVCVHMTTRFVFCSSYGPKICANFVAALRAFACGSKEATIIYACFSALRAEKQA